MVVKTFILVISALTFTSSQQMTCTYFFNPTDSNRYQCDLSINNTNGLDDAESIGGVHYGSYKDPYGNLISPYNDSSVQIVTIVGLTKNIPSAICRQFPNTEKLTFSNSNIEILSATKCSKATELRLSFNLIENALIDLCQFQPALKVIYFNNNKLKVFSNVALNSCKNLQFFNVDNNQISGISSTLFANTSIIHTISFGGNPIPTIPDGIFNGLPELKTLTMRDLHITDMPLNIFPTINKLSYLSIANNRFTQYRREWFQNLNQLTYLWLNYNKIPMSSDFFKPMPLLRYVYMQNCNISVVDPQWFSTLTSLYSLSFWGNNITEISDNTFTTTTALRYLEINYNKLKTVRSKWFSNAVLQNIYFFNAEYNEINAIDPLFFDIAQNINILYLNNNKCYTGPAIMDFAANRSTYMPGFKSCMENFV